MTKIQIVNVLSKPRDCNALFYSLIKNSRFIAEGEGIMYSHNNLPEHIQTLCDNNQDTENTQVCSDNSYLKKGRI